MATKVIVTLVDDLDGTGANETITFRVDGVDYEIDLSTENAARLRRDFGAWVEVSRRIGGRRRDGPPARATASGQVSASAAIRAWARRSGREIAGRGRIPGEIMEAFLAAGKR